MAVLSSRRVGLIPGLAMLFIPAAGAVEIAPNEFRDAGGTLVCTTRTAEPEMRDCLRIGPVRIGQSLRDIAMMFGDPYRVVDQGDTTLRVYTIDIGVPQGQPVPYWVLGFDKDRRVVSIQMTGERGDNRFAFSSIRLGDPAGRVIKILGKPYVTREVQDIEGAEFWGYTPFPISIEIKNNRVYSIRVSEAARK